MKKTVMALIIFSLLGFIAIPLSDAKDDYPTGPITCIVPYGAGGMTDTSARLLAEKIKAEFGQPIVVVNKKGAAGIVGTMHFLTTKPDGYTVLVNTSDTAILPLYQKQEAIDLNRFKYAASYMIQERVLFAPIDAPYKSFEEFVAYVKQNPGKVSVGGGADIWAQHIMKSIAVKDGLKMKYVMFESGGDASSAILGGHVDVCETGVGTPAYQAAKAGKLNILIALGAGKVPGFPNVPNVKQKGYPFHETLAYGILLHAETPEPIRQKWENAMKKVLQDPDLGASFRKLGLEPEFVDGRGWETICKDAMSVVKLIEYVKGID